MATAVAVLVSVGCAAAGEPQAPEGPEQSVAAPSTTTSQAPTELNIVFAGDVHFAERTADLLDDPESAFGPVSEVLSAADLAIVNLETPVTKRGTAQQKRWLFKAPPSAYAAITAAGVDAVSVGNNHTLDYGEVGLLDTLEHAHEAGVPTFGAGRNAHEAWAPWITDVQGVRVALIGISQVHELAEEWTATGDRFGVAHSRNVDRSVQAVAAAKAEADVVLVYMHWGQESNECPTDEMKTFAQHLSDAGADAIIGTHAHLLQGDGWLDGTYVAYGLGNFLWWWNDAASNDTGLVRLVVADKRIADTEFVPAAIDRTTGQPIPADGAEATRISEKFEALRDCTGLASTPSGS